MLVDRQDLRLALANLGICKPAFIDFQVLPTELSMCTCLVFFSPYGESGRWSLPRPSPTLLVLRCSRNTSRAGADWLWRDAGDTRGLRCSDSMPHSCQKQFGIQARVAALVGDVFEHIEADPACAITATLLPAVSW